MGGLLKQYIQEMFGVPVLFLNGGVRPKQRTEMVRRFQADDVTPALLRATMRPRIYYELVLRLQTYN